MEMQWLMESRNFIGMDNNNEGAKTKANSQSIIKNTKFIGAAEIDAALL